METNISCLGVTSTGQAQANNVYCVPYLGVGNKVISPFIREKW